MQLHAVGKGCKIREVPLRSEVVEVAKEYMNTERREHKFSDSEYLLLTQRSGKMDRDAVNKLLNKHGEYLAITMRPHKFRHTFCTRLLIVGVPLTTVSKLAGHSSIQTVTSHIEIALFLTVLGVDCGAPKGAALTLIGALENLSRKSLARVV